jgi:hypothetical protein
MKHYINPFWLVKVPLALYASQVYLFSVYVCMYTFYWEDRYFASWRSCNCQLPSAIVIQTQVNSVLSNVYVWISSKLKLLFIISSCNKDIVNIAYNMGDTL